MNLNTDPYSADKWRILGPLANLPEFHTAFGCAAGVPMIRPEAERPSIW